MQIPFLYANFPTRFELQIWITKFMAILFDVLPWNVTPSSRFSCNNYLWSTYQLFFLYIRKRIARKLRIVFSDPKKSKLQLILRSVYKLMNMLIKLQTNNNKLQIHTYCDTLTPSLMLINCKYQTLIFMFHWQSICCFSVVSLDTGMYIRHFLCNIFYTFHL